MAEALFYLMALGAVGFGAGVVTARMPMHSVLCLLGAFFCLAVIYLLAGFQFLAATQLLVYAGAIMVLFLFVVMLLNLGDEDELRRNSGLALSGRRLTVAAVGAGTLGLLGILGAGWGHTQAADEALGASAATLPEGGLDDLELLADVLFSRYMLPFEAASLLLLATMIAVIMLAKRQRPGETAAEEPLGWPWDKGVEP